MEGGESSFKTISIKEITDKINERKYLLPAIQREFVWDEKQIIDLFDSLMNDYPIGSFLFWEIKKEKVNRFQFYEFIKEYHERDKTHNPPARNVSEDITTILDGQQRLASIYIALKGTYSDKMKGKWRDNDKAYPERKLYLNLLSKPKEFDRSYDFDFLTEEAAKRDQKSYWFEVGKVVGFKELPDVNEYLRENDLPDDNKNAYRTLTKLFQVINDRGVINFYLETSEELDKVLKIFIRVNSGGTQLSYSDLLLSIATAQWKEKDARQEINDFVDFLNKIGDGFEFNKDFVLKSCLVLSDINDIAFKVDNFNAENIKKIEEKWDSIKVSLELSVRLVNSFRYNRENLTANNAVIPIAYFIMSEGNPPNFVDSNKFKDDKERIKDWFMRSLLKQVFSSQTDNVLRSIREIIRKNDEGFPFDKILDELAKRNKPITFTEKDVENLLSYPYGKKHTFSAMLLLYPNLDLKNNKFHQDHIFPKKCFGRRELERRDIPKEDIDFYKDNFNYIPNLQLLEGTLNAEKSGKDFKVWFEENYKTDKQKKDYRETHYLPEEAYFEFSKFKDFFEKRKKKIKKKFEELLL